MGFVDSIIKIGGDAIDYTAEALQKMIEYWTGRLTKNRQLLESFSKTQSEEREMLQQEARAIRIRISALESELRSAVGTSNIGTEHCITALDEVYKELEKLEKWI